MQENKKVYLLSLGCPKNEVDAESMLYIIKEAGYDFCTEPAEADYLIVNTCGFIEPAKREAIDHCLELADHKGKNSKLIVTGCLPQRYMKEIYEYMPEVDACIGTAEYDQIANVLKALDSDNFIRCDRPLRPGSLKHLEIGRLANTSRPFAYLKVAEGCSNNCAFCAIPGIRGLLKSRSLNSLVREAKSLDQEGFKELILVAQDTARYGTDLNDGTSLVLLLQRLLEETSFPWFRLMYTYGDAITDELIELMAKEPRILPYIDMPIQHASDKILKRMGRHESQADIRSTMAKLRARIPNLILRTTILLGFPGETEEDVREVMDFIKKEQFDRLGCFAFSPEENTRAYRMADQVPLEISEKRVARVMALQERIAKDRAEARLFEKVDVLVEGVADDGIFYLGRSFGEAPEIDPVIYLLNRHERDLAIGDIVEARLIEVSGYDFTAETVYNALEDEF